jgi:hypothetical protein
MGEILIYSRHSKRHDYDLSSKLMKIINQDIFSLQKSLGTYF